jgi:hypothetical protein
MIPDAKLAWVAAVLDLKGAVIRKNNQTRATPQLVLYVDSKQHGVVRELCQLTGQDAEPHTPRPKKEWMQRGCAEHCPEPDREHSGELPPTSRWTVTGAAAAVILHNVIPFMVTSRGVELEEAMNEMVKNLALTGRGSGAVFAASRRLADLGWELPLLLAKRLREVAAGEREGMRS